MGEETCTPGSHNMFTSSSSRLYARSLSAEMVSGSTCYFGVNVSTSRGRSVYLLKDRSSYIKVSKSAQDMDIGLGEAESETSSKRSV
ncbi:hypothetical protein Tco_1520412 [Tanacetum coccineum]